jgi:hypothetical protein
MTVLAVHTAALMDMSKVHDSRLAGVVTRDNKFQLYEWKILVRVSGTRS